MDGLTTGMGPVWSVGRAAGGELTQLARGTARARGPCSRSRRLGSTSEAPHRSPQHERLPQKPPAGPAPEQMQAQQQPPAPWQGAVQLARDESRRVPAIEDPAHDRWPIIRLGAQAGSPAPAGSTETCCAACRRRVGPSWSAARARPLRRAWTRGARSARSGTRRRSAWSVVAVSAPRRPAARARPGPEARGAGAMSWPW